jgi:hypothetical protein
VFRSNPARARLQSNSPLPRIRGSLRIRVPAVTSQQSRFSEGDNGWLLCGPREDTSGQTPEPIRTEHRESSVHFKRRVRSSSRVRWEFKGRSSSSSEKGIRVGILEPSQPSRLAGPGRRVGPVGPSGIQGIASGKLILLKKLIQVNYLSC